jgi:hypothetical protein
MPVKLLSRSFIAFGLTLALSAGALVTDVGVAHALNSTTTCPSAGSTRLVTAGFFGQNANAYELWVYQPVGSTDTYICFRADTFTNSGINGVIDVNTAESVTPPTVTPTTGTGACPTRITTITDPAQVVTSVGETTTPLAICLGLNGSTTTLTFGLPSVNTLPTVTLWGDANTVLATAICDIKFAGSPPSGCATSDAQLAL